MSESLEKRALIATADSQAADDDRFAAAAARSLEASGAEWLVLAVATQDAAAAERLIERLGWPAERARIETIDDAADLDAVFRAMNAAINRLIARGVAPENIRVNYTRGAKPLCVGAALSAVLNSCDGLECFAERGEPPPPRAAAARPRAVFAYRDLERARAHILATQMRSAIEALDGADGSLLSEYDRGVKENLAILARAYQAWEQIRIGDFLNLYSQANLRAKELAPFRLRPEQREALERLRDDCQAGRPSPLVCVEMRNGAERLLREGHLDAATQRLYRALEILAHYCLEQRHGIAADDLDTRKAPPRDRARFEAMRSLDDGLIKIGLRKAYELLMLLEDPVGIDFSADEALADALRKRDYSLMAHGMNAISAEDVRAFLRAASAFFLRHIEDFSGLCRALRFPWFAPEEAERAHAPNGREA